MEVGQISKVPVPTRFGLHILRLDAKAKGEVLPYEAVKPQISELLEKADWARAANAFVAELVQDAEVTGISFQDKAAK